MITYQSMIEDAIITLGENEGSSAASIWKCIAAKHPAAVKHKFHVSLKKLKDDFKNDPAHSMIVEDKKTRRIRLASSYQKKLIRQLQQALPKIQKTKSTTKKSLKNRTPPKESTKSNKKTLKENKQRAMRVSKSEPNSPVRSKNLKSKAPPLMKVLLTRSKMPSKSFRSPPV